MPTIGPFNNHAEVDDVELELLDKPDPKATWGNPGKRIKGWTSFNVTSDFTTAVDSWELELVSQNTPPGQEPQDGDLAVIQRELQNGQRVGIRVNGSLVCTGYVDQIQIGSSVGSGTVMHVRGRDALAPACDTCVDPHFTFPDDTTIRSFIEKLFAPFGFSRIVVSDKVNRQKLTRNFSVLSVDAKDQVVEKLLSTTIGKKFLAHQHEGVYEYASRIGRRYGFMIWCGLDGTTLYVGQPDYDQEPIGALQHLVSDSSTNNILEIDVTWDWSRQPTCIIASASGGGGEFNYVTLKSLMVNELLADSDQIQVIQDLKKQYKNASVVPRRDYIKRPDRVVEITKFAKASYATDDESKNQKQLDNYTKRLMAEFQSKFLQVRIQVAGFGQGNSLWAPNTMVQVWDEPSGLKQTLWIKSRTFSASRSGGSTTSLNCILPHTFDISPQEIVEAVKSATVPKKARKDIDREEALQGGYANGGLRR